MVDKTKPKKGNRDAGIDMQARLRLIEELQSYLSDLTGTQAEKAKKLSITQPRLNDLLNGRVEKFSLEALINLASNAGFNIQLNVQKVKMPDNRQIIPLTPTYTSSVFSPKPEQLNLEPKQATELIRNILWCDAIASGLSPKDVILSLRIHESDGGIDAKVEGSLHEDSLLTLGSTYYQIKTGSGFKPWQDSSLKMELFGKKKPITRKNLKPAIRECFDKDGTYTILTFGHDLTPEKHQKSIDTAISLLKKCGYSNPKIKLYGQGQLAGEIGKYPSICADLIGLSDCNFRTLSGWQRISHMQTDLKLGLTQTEFIDALRKNIQENNVQHIRIIGEPGIGKTRLTLEALSSDNIAPSVIYVPTGEDFQKSKLFNEILKEDRRYFATLVIDDCDNRDMTSIWQNLKGLAGIKLITISHNDEDTHDSAMKKLSCPALSEKEIKEIFAAYTGNQDLYRWAGLCGGFPGVAHLLGENLKNNPNDLLKSPADVPIWERFIIGHKEIQSGEEDQCQIVLTHIALFQRFGFESPVTEEARFISRWIERDNPVITWNQFQKIVQRCRDRRIIQGKHTLYIFPKALHIYLWIKFWKDYGRDFSFQKFFDELPKSMHHWFLQQFKYAHTVQQAQHIVKDILSDGGLFSDKAFFFSAVGLRLLNYLTEAAPSEVLVLLENTIGTWSYEQLYKWRGGRQEVVSALEKIIVWESLFTRSVQILINMALAENSNYSNNSKGVLLSLFSIGLGWAPTQVSPSIRLPLLEELVKNSDANRRNLGLELCSKWLETHGGGRVIGAEHQGLQQTIEFWKPKTYSEVFNYWRDVLKVLRDEIEGLDSTWRNKFAKVLLNAARSLIRYEQIAEEIFELVLWFSKDQSIDRKLILDFFNYALKVKNSSLTKSEIKILKQLDAILEGTNLFDRINRYIYSMSPWETYYEISGDAVRKINVQEKQLKPLVKESISDIDIFSDVLLEMSAKEIKQDSNIFAFGLECGKQSFNEEWDENITSLIKEKIHGIVNVLFISGYIAGLRTRDPSRWEAILRRLLSSEKTREVAIDCILKSGITEVLLYDMILLFKNKSLSVKSFSFISVKEDIQGISKTLFQDLLAGFVFSNQEGSAAICIELISIYYLNKNTKKSLPEQITFDTLSLKPLRASFNQVLFSYSWGQVAEAFLEQFPQRSLDLLENLLKIIADSSNYPIEYKDNLEKIANSIVKSNPEDAWTLISKALVSNDQKIYGILHWLNNSFSFSEDASSIIFIPPDQIIAWVKEDPSIRKELIQEVLPRSLDPKQGGNLTSQFIEAFIEEKKLTNALIAHFCTDSLRGSANAHFSKKCDQARSWLSSSIPPKVRIWLERYIEVLTDKIQDEGIREERDFYS